MNLRRAIDLADEGYVIALHPFDKVGSLDRQITREVVTDFLIRVRGLQLILAVQNGPLHNIPMQERFATEKFV